MGPSQNPIFNSLAVDSNGDPHIAYAYLQGTAAENMLKYTHKTGGSWYSEDPDPGSTAMDVSIVLDASDRPHIAYTVQAPSLEQHLKYASKPGTAWVVQTVDNVAGLHAGPVSLAMDSSGGSHISYWNATSNDLKYAARAGSFGPWNPEILESDGDVGRWSSISIDSDDVPHIAYYSNLALKYARRYSGWMIETVDVRDGLNVGRYASLTLDSEGRPHIAYEIGNFQSLMYAYGSPVPSCPLEDNGDGTVTDLCTDLMWLQDASYAYTSGHDADGMMNWHDAMAWADGLIFGGYSDWRLPATLVPDPSCGDFGPDYVEGYCTGGEMGRLYYDALGNSTGFGGFTNSEPFVNIGEDGDPAPNYAFYWSATEMDASNAHHFLFDDGYTNPSDMNKISALWFAWALRDVLPTDTPTGPNAEVTPAPGVSVTFGDVATAGETTVTVSPDDPGGGSTGFGFELFGNFYDIETTADYADDPGDENVTVCLNYDELALPAGANEEDVQVKRWNGTSWEDPITSSVDTVHNITCGTFPSLSWFGVAVPLPAPDDDGDGVPNSVDQCPGTPAGVPVDVDGCPTMLGPFTLPDVVKTPSCWFSESCTPDDFPFDWGIVETFEYTLTPGWGIEDILINGTWGGDVFNSSAPVEVYLEGILVTECLMTDPCWSEASKVDWNGGEGFLLSDLGVDFTDPAILALFWDGSADLSLIQTDIISANISNLSLTLYLPEPGGVAGLLVGLGWLVALTDRRRTRDGGSQSRGHV
jgi:hypothetical protein